MRLIDADALIAEHCSACTKDIQEDCKTDPVCATLMWLIDAPTINPESLRAKGEWVDKMVRDWHCPECGKSVPKQVRFDGYCYDDKLNFCPNCGADMRGDAK